MLLRASDGCQGVEEGYRMHLMNQFISRAKRVMIEIFLLTYDTQKICI